MYTGIVGKLVIDTKEIAYISNWSVEDTTDMLEATYLGESYKTKTPGLQSWSASADGTAFFGENGQSTLFAAKHSGKEVEVQFYLNDKTKSASVGDKDVFLKGKAYIESLSIDLSAEDKGNISISIAGTGALRLVNDTTVIPAEPAGI